MVTSSDLSMKLKYLVMPGKFAPGFPASDTHNRTYQLWKKVWKDVFTEAGNPAALVADDFLRQDFVCALQYEHDIIGCHLYTFFNIDQNVSLDHRYFSIFPPDTIEVLRKRKATYLMTMEFLTVHPDWRKFSLGPVLINLGANVLKATGAHAAIGPARKKTKVDQMTYKLGFDCLKANVSRGNLDCDIVALFPQNIKTYPDLEVVSLASSLWENRTDFTGKLGETNFSKKKAA